MDHGSQRARARQRGARALSPLLRFVHLAALSSLALAQPLLDLLGRNAEFFAVRGLGALDVLAFALGLVVVPPLLLLAPSLLAGLVRPVLGRGLHVAAVGALAGLLALQAAAKTELASTVLLPACALVAAGAAAAYARTRAARAFATLLAPAPVLVLAVFLLGTPVRALVFPADPEPRPAAAAAAARTPVVLVVFDEIATTSLLGADGRIDRARFPAFASLADESTWFRNAATVDAWTVNAVPALLTGTLPEHGRLPVFSEHPDNLFTLLGGDGRRLVVSESLTELCPRSLCPRTRPPVGRRAAALAADAGVVLAHVLAPRDLRARLPSVSSTWGAFLETSHERTRRRLDLYREFVRALADRPPPALAFAHVMLPHIPWEYLPSGRRYDSGGVDIPGFATTAWGRDAYLVDQGRQRYLLQLGFVDRLLGDLVRRLREVGLYERSLVVVTADHGVSFRPGERRRALTPATLADVAFVPLLVKAPRQRTGRVVDEPVQLVDVAPTIARFLGIRLPWRADGRWLYAPRGRAEFRFVGDAGPLVADPGRLVARRDAAASAERRLFADGLFAVGPNRDLVGKPAPALAVSDGSGARAQVDQAAALRDLDLRGEYVPARLTGRIAGGGAPRDLAVALNGRIAAVGRSFLAGGDERFSILVPEDEFRQGANTLRLFAVAPGDRLVAL